LASGKLHSLYDTGGNDFWHWYLRICRSVVRGFAAERGSWLTRSGLLMLSAEPVGSSIFADPSDRAEIEVGEIFPSGKIFTLWAARQADTRSTTRRAHSTS